MSTPIKIIDGLGLGYVAGVTSDNALQVTIVPPNVLSGLIFGKVLTNSTSEFIIRSTTYTEQNVNGKRSISSNNINDTSNGTGARSIIITYYNNSIMGPFTEIVPLNGTTAVATQNSDICFIENMSVIDVGSNMSNIGTISLFVDNSGGGGTIGTIAIGNNQTFWAHHYIGGDKICNINTIVAGTNGNQNGIIYIQKQNPLISTSSLLQISDTIVAAQNSSSIIKTSVNPLKINGPARIALYVTPSGANTNWFASFDFFDELII